MRQAFVTGIALVAFGCGPDGAPLEAEEDALFKSVQVEGKRLFEEETFGGNGRTCLTCHSAETGTLSLEQIADLHAEDPNAPLFRGDGSDDGKGNGASRIVADGTILVTLPLPDNAILLDAPFTREVTLRRGIPSTRNTPALDPVLMDDGRAPDLMEQARDAIIGHAEATIAPTEEELELIALFQQEAEHFFSNPELLDWARGGPPPVLPEGNTESEKRGRRFFDDVPLAPPSTRGMCAICHSGPMLNESNGFNPLPVPPWFVPKGERFQSILSSELRPNGDPIRTYLAENPDGTVTVTAISDPGRALITGDFRGFPFGDLGEFKIPTLWGVEDTAPYFHNNSAHTLEEVVDHYAEFFIIATPIAMPGAPPIVMTEQDKQDLLAYLRLL